MQNKVCVYYFQYILGPKNTENFDITYTYFYKFLIRLDSFFFNKKKKSIFFFYGQDEWKNK